MIWLAFPAFVILSVRLAVVLVNLLSRQYLREEAPADSSLVSVLIPARNEDKTLPHLLDGLLEQDYDQLEFLVYNDDSTDGTGEVLKRYAGKDDRIRILQGSGVPEGWNGKNNACHQLALQAKGAYFLFLDADVQVAPGLIQKAVAFSQRYDLTLLSIFPRQLMHSFGELVTVPTMNWILLSLLPLRLIRRSHYPSLSAANGQFMLFRAREYRHHQFHQMVKDINVEDIHIIRRIKQMGYVAQTLLSKGEVSCRMYDSFRDAVFGFTRSMFAFFGGSGPALIIFTVFTTFGFWFVWEGMIPEAAWVYLMLAMMLRIFVAWMSYQPVGKLLVLSPLIHLSFIWMVIQSFKMKARGRNIWKGREIRFRGI
jgi:glycosyltransferase involved in cell wall biosynthesis